MSIQITINGENATEALTELSALAAGFAGGQASPSEAPKTSRSRSTTKQETVKPDKPDPEPEQTDEDPTPSDSDAPIPTDVELRESASEAGKRLKEAGKDHKAAIKALLSKYGVPNVTAVPDEKRIALQAELEAL